MARSRIRAKGLGQWWERPLWATVIGGLIVAAVVAAATSLSSSSSRKLAADSTGANRINPLQVEFKPVAPPFLFAIAFPYDIGLPAPSEQWATLSKRGGIDVGKSDFELTLANRSQLPLTITNIEAEVLESSAPPTEWEGSVFTQGVEGLDKFVATLASASPGSTAPLHLSEGKLGIPTTPPFFTTHDISLQHGQIYQATVTVVTGTGIARQLQYRFSISGDTALGAFSVHAPGIFRITAPGSTYTHEYWLLKEGPTSCWVTVSHGLPSCS